MYQIATISAYDVMDQVHIVARVRQYDAIAPGEGSEFAWETTIPGEGECEPGQWLREVLVGLIEVL